MKTTYRVLGALLIALSAAVPGCYQFEDLLPWNWHLSEKHLPKSGKTKRGTPVGEQTSGGRRQKPQRHGVARAHTDGARPVDKAEPAT